MGGFTAPFLRGLLSSGGRNEVEHSDLCRAAWDAGSDRPPRPAYRAPTDERQAHVTRQEAEKKALTLMTPTPSAQSMNKTATKTVRKPPFVKPKLPSKPCRCGETEWWIFMLSFFEKDPFVPVRITWIPCPVHPCAHSRAEESSKDNFPGELGFSATSVEPERQCICSSFEQMMAQPEARKKYEEAEARESGSTVTHYPWT
jgi:hypothetical protein